jgi:2-iminobutanoate/2-iminopropanoate deaminase
MTAALSAINPTSFAPAFGPYSEAICAGDMIFVAGQVAVDENNEVIGRGDPRAQTTAALERVETILGEVGATLQDVAMATVFLANLDDFDEYNSGWAAKFGDHKPARATVSAGLLGDGVLVEIQVTAVCRT